MTQQSEGAIFQLLDNRTENREARQLEAAINTGPKQTIQRQQLNRLFGITGQLRSSGEDSKQLRPNYSVVQCFEKKQLERIPNEIKIALTKSKDDPKAAVLGALKSIFGDELVSATKDPEVIKAVLKTITQESGLAKKGAVISPAKPSLFEKRNIKNLDEWTLRHYTDKYSFDDRKQKIGPPPYMEILSALTLAAMKLSDEKEETLEEVRGKTGASKSGHTTALDWGVIGNVGDTFYVLCKNGDPVVKATFLNDAVYYAEWALSDISEIWASSDWLGIATGQEKLQGPVMEGAPIDVLAQALGFQSILLGATGSELGSQNPFKQKFNNFEVKIHGSMKVNKWIPTEHAKTKEEKLKAGEKSKTGDQ
jgi:hypothetical protein